MSTEANYELHLIAFLLLFHEITHFSCGDNDNTLMNTI